MFIPRNGQKTPVGIVYHNKLWHQWTYLI